MDTQKDVVVATEKQPTYGAAAKYAVAVIVATLATQSAYAAEIDAIGAGLSDEIGAVKTIIVGLFTLGAVLLGLFAGFRYLKRGANSA